jgi:structural hemagglutinin/hemolysin toxin protein RtxA
MNVNYLLSFYVPESHLHLVKSAVFACGAGEFNEYKHCAWQIEGEGQYLPSSNATPYIGTQKKLTNIKEYKVEIHCTEKVINKAVIAMKKAHPYEVPAYHVLKICDY